MKKLLFIGNTPPEVIDGVSIAFHINLQALQRDYTITTIKEESQISQHDKIAFSKIINILRKSLQLFRAARQSTYDVAYFNLAISTFGAIKTLLFALALKIAQPRIKIFLHLHRGDFFTQFYSSFLNKFLTTCIFRLAYRVILLSAQQLKEFTSVFQKDIFVALENTIELEHKRSKKDNTIIQFCFISNYFKEKGFYDLLRVFEHLAEKFPNIALYTFGKSPKPLESKWIESLRQKRVHINDAILGEAKYEIIAESDCLILPSWNEGQPLVLLEAMSQATPIIASNVGLIQETLGRDYLWLIAPQNTDDLYEKIKDFILLPPNQKRALGETLYKQYADTFSNEKHHQKLYSIFK